MQLQDEWLKLVYWFILEYTVCQIKGHIQDYDDFEWCTRCYKPNVFEVQ